MSEANDSNELLGVGVFIERDQVSVGVKDGELLRSPWLAFQRGIRVHYGLACALSVQPFYCLDLYSAACCFRNVPICASPEVNLDWTVRNNAVLTLGCMLFVETELGYEELDTSLDIKRCENGGCGNELGGCAHTGVATPNVGYMDSPFAQGRGISGNWQGCTNISGL